MHFYVPVFDILCTWRNAKNYLTFLFRKSGSRSVLSAYETDAILSIKNETAFMGEVIKVVYLSLFPVVVLFLLIHNTGLERTFTVLSESVQTWLLPSLLRTFASCFFQLMEADDSDVLKNFDEDEQPFIGQQSKETSSTLQKSLISPG